MTNALKKTRNLATCLHKDELDMFEELKKFMAPFEELTQLVSTTGPTL